MSVLAARVARWSFAGVCALLAAGTALITVVADEPAVLATGRAWGLVGAWLAVGAVGLVLPLSRARTWPATAMAMVVVVGLAVGDRVTHLSSVDESVVYYPVAFLLVLGWTGFSQRRGRTVLVGVVAVVALVTIVTNEHSVVPAATLALTLPVAVLVGETLGWQNTRLGQRRAVDDRRVDDLQALATSVTVLRDGRTNLDEAAELLGRLANDIFRGDYVTTVLRGGKGRLVPASRGARPEAPSPETARVVGQAIADAEVKLVAENGSRLLVIPFVGPTEIGGACVVRQSEHSDDPFNLHMARLFASQAGSALEQIQVIENLSEDLRRDDLTGIGNSRHARALVDSLTPGDAVVLIDLDHFKAVNDTRGHAAGDELLQALSTHLRDSVRDSDLVARLGGDEFVLVARDAEADALLTAGRLLEQWRHASAGSTFSAGVAVHDRDDIPAQTLKHADKALYRAKEKGRDRVSLFGEDPIDRFERRRTTDAWPEG